MPFLVAYPWLAFVVAAALAVLDVRRPTPAARRAALCWAVYGGYEYLMYARVLCSGECNIRVDLLVVHPALIVITVVAVVRARRRPRPAPGSTVDGRRER
jgi:hypothetical protein